MGSIWIIVRLVVVRFSSEMENAERSEELVGRGCSSKFEERSEDYL